MESLRNHLAAMILIFSLVQTENSNMEYNRL
jgi:hypothetical protein